MTSKEFVGSDAAADEVKAGRLSKQGLFRNLRVPLRDPAHAAGRLLGLNLWSLEILVACVACEADNQVEFHTGSPKDLV